MKKLFILLSFFLFNYLNIFSQVATLESTLELKDINGIKVPYQNGIPLPTFEKQKRTIIDLSGSWKKQRFVADDNISLAKRDEAGLTALINEAAGRNLFNYDDSNWEDKILPNVENNMNPYPNTPEFYNDGIWYRKHFTIYDSLNNKYFKLMFYAVNYVCDVWINDIYIGYHEGGYTPFAFDITSAIKFGEDNVIAIRIDNIAWNARNDIVPYTICDWFNYAGLMHDIYIEVSEPISTIRANIVPLDINGNIETTIVISNDENNSNTIDAQIEIYEADINENNIQSEFSYELLGNKIQVEGEYQKNIIIDSDSISVWKTNLKINNPKLWSPKNPNLYIMKVSLIKNEKVVDEYYTQFGVRTIKTIGNKFVLNNRIMFLTGTARHEDHPVYGRSIPKDIIYSDLVLIKNLNVNFLRTAHYPNNLYTYLIADRLGIVIMEEIPVWWFNNVEPWLIQNNQRKIHYQMFREMVFKDYNRPSIALWSTSNECKESDNRLIYHQTIKEDQIQNYNDGRLITQSAAADSPGPNDISQSPLDVAGWTMYYGVFYGKDYYSGTVSFILNAKNSYPNKPILDTEFGYWSSEDSSTINDQSTVFNETFRAFKFFSAVSQDGKENLNGPLMACTWWCVFDWYQYRVGGWQTMGLYTMDRQNAKPVASTLRNSYAPYFNNEGVITDVKDDFQQIIPKEFKLEQNFPNPFNPETKIIYQIPKDGLVTLIIYDILGREVRTLVNGQQKTAGRYEVEFNGKELSSGMYFYKLEVSNLSNGKSFIDVKKMILLK